MAETYSSQYQALFVTKPPAKTARYGVSPKTVPINYAQILVGAAADTIVVAQLPPFSDLDMVASWLYGVTFTSGATISMGWKAFVDADGVTQPLSATGLLNASDIPTTGWIITAGMQSQATPDDAITEMTVRTKNFNNMSPVDIFITVNTQAPGVGAILEGRLYYSNIG
jgi:hypothetical protein